MAKAGEGAIVNVSSYAVINSMLEVAPYSAAKAGVEHLSQVFASTLAPVVSFGAAGQVVAVAVSKNSLRPENASLAGMLIRWVRRVAHRA